MDSQPSLLDDFRPSVCPSGWAKLAPAARACEHRLRFASLFHPGRGIAVPCDADGEVHMDDLPERLKNAYLGARALVGREYAFPVVERMPSLH